MKVGRGYRRIEHLGRDSQVRVEDEFISREGATAMSRRAKNANGKAAKPYPFGRTILAGRGSLAPGPHMTRCRENVSRAC
jgi:hypothetical protein